jgi:hypothetical protein
MPPVGVRWTIGDVSAAGFKALQLSIRSAYNLFGQSAQYAVCVNTISVRDAITRTGDIPAAVRWVRAGHTVPPWLRRHVSPEMAEGVAWKLLPVRVFPHLYELSLDNDVVLWSLPPALLDWLASEEPEACLLAADVQPALGQFADLCNYRALNSGIRGLPPGFELETRLRDMLLKTGITLRSELDEQGLQAAVLLQSHLFVVSTKDVSICSPFPNHQHHLGRCGVHFVGLNPKSTPWVLEGRSAHEVICERWHGYASQLAQLTGTP